MNLTVLSEKMAILKGKPEGNIPSWVFTNKKFVSIAFTDEELSIVCSEESVPNDHGLTIDKGWKCIKVIGPLDFSLTGILSSLAAPLAEANISIFAISTYDTDYLMVKEDNIEAALEILTENGKNILV